MAHGLEELTAEAFTSKVLKADRLVLVEFGAPWCGPCKMLDPVLSELATAYGEKVDFYTINVDHTPDLVMSYGILGVPTVILFHNGQPRQRMTGYRPKHALEKMFLLDL